MISRTFKLSAGAILAASFVAPVAMADIGGGGATLPAKAYHGSNASGTATGPRLSFPASGSLFDVALPNEFQTYCQVGSGSGRSVLISSSGNTDDSRDCPADFTTSFVNGTNGFSAPRVDTDFAGSDAPASSSDFSTFVTNEGAQHTQMTQFPAVAGLISVIYNNSSIAGTVYLSEAELCNIFNGNITNWNQIAKSSGKPFPSMPITVVYRTDSSGTSFSMSNHLNWVCSDSALNKTLAPAADALPFAVANNFSVQSTFTSAFPGGTPPSNSAGASGNPGVISAVQATDGAIGYAETGNALAEGVTVARIAAVDTASELNPASPYVARNTALYLSSIDHGKTFTVPTTFTDKDGSVLSGTYTDRALQSNNATYGRPVGLPPAITVPNPNCAYIVHPGAYATSLYKTAGSATSGYANYPIIGVSYLMGNYSGNNNETTMETLFGAPYNTALRSSVTSVGVDTGYYYLATLTGTTLSGGTKKLNQARIDACVN